MKAQSEILKPSKSKHNRQFFLEILLPIIIAAVLLLSLFIITALVVSSGKTPDSRPVDIAIIVIMIPTGILFLIGIVISLLISNLLFKANHSLPQFLFKAQEIVARAATQIQAIAMISVVPIIKAKSVSAGISSFFASFRKNR
jgi:hypothetical protein